VVQVAMVALVALAVPIVPVTTEEMAALVTPLGVLEALEV